MFLQDKANPDIGVFANRDNVIMHLSKFELTDFKVNFRKLSERG